MFKGNMLFCRRDIKTHALKNVRKNLKSQNKNCSTIFYVGRPHQILSNWLVAVILYQADGLKKSNRCFRKPLEVYLNHFTLFSLPTFQE
jgi:hypothetical protein